MCHAPPNFSKSPNPLDTKLRQLIQDACNHSKGSAEHRKMVKRIFDEMQKSGEIPKGETQDIETHCEALQRTWIWFGENVCNFNPEMARNPVKATVVGWFKTYYRYKRREIWREIQRLRKREVNPEIFDNEGSKTPLLDILNIDPILNPSLQWNQDPLSELELQELEEINRNLISKVRKCVENHCGLLLRTKYVAGHPHIHCQLLLLRQLPSWNNQYQEWNETPSWQELEQELGIPKRHLIDCYNRRLSDKKCMGCLRTCLGDSLHNPG